MTDNTARKYDSADFQESNFGIRSKEDMKHIFDVMRNKIYSNKILAVLREYSTNACDAHIESGQRDRPIEVTLPTSSNRFLSIRDFGTGLSEEDIRNVYTMYGASTKRGSSELNGQLGFGSKAAFSYSDSYTIISYHNGQKVTYEAYVDETGLGAISQISKEDTLEPSGIEIRVAVQLHDIANFRDTAVKLYKHFQVTPKVNNLNGARIERPTYKLRGTTWGLRESGGHGYGHRDENMAIMGNVAYPLNRQVLQDNLKQYPDWRRYEQLLGCPIDFFTPVGQLSIAASREALEYDKKSLRTFQEYFNTAIKEITEEFSKRIANAKDIVEAKQCYKLLMHGELRSLAGIIEAGSGLSWNGQRINDYHFTVPSITYETEVDGTTQEAQAFNVRVIEPVNTSAGIKQFQINAGRQFEITDEAKVFQQDTDDKPMLRLRKFFQDNPAVKKVYLFKATAHTTIAEIATESGVPVQYFASLAALDPLVVENNRAAGPHNIKHSRKVFQMADPTPNGGYADSTYWGTVEIDADQEYYYVYLDRFTPQLQLQGRSTGNTTFRSMLEAYQQLTGVNLRPRVIGVKVGAAERVAPTWRSLESVIREGLEGQVQTAAATLENVALRDLRQQHHILNWLETGRFDNVLNQLDANSPMRRFYTRYRRATMETANNRNSAYDGLQNISRQLNMTFPALETLLQTTQARVTAEINALMVRYPLLRWVQVGYGQRPDGHFVDSIRDYVQSIDANRGTG